jgi:hypothetical protein
MPNEIKTKQTFGTATIDDFSPGRVEQRPNCRSGGQESKTPSTREGVGPGMLSTGWLFSYRSSRYFPGVLRLLHTTTCGGQVLRHLLHLALKTVVQQHWATRRENQGKKRARLAAPAGLRPCQIAPTRQAGGVLPEIVVSLYFTCGIASLILCTQWFSSSAE